MKILTRFAFIALFAVALVGGCDWKFWDSPTDPIEPKVPFGEPVDIWESGIGDVLIYETGGRNWSDSTETEFQIALDDLLFRIDRVVGPQERGQLTLDEMNLVLQDSREDPIYVASERAFWVSGPDEFQRVALEFFCNESKSAGICDLEL
jgi:hypothetical protein